MAKIFVCGDLLNTVTRENFFSSQISDVIKGADYSICNFEAPVESDGSPIKKAGPHKEQYSETVSILKAAGFDLLLLANNHIFDYGKEGLERTLEEANHNSLDTIGAELDFDNAYRPLIKDINGLKIGFINASEAQFGVLTNDYKNDSGYAWINHPKINDIVVSLEKQVDYLMFFAHAGLENYEIPLIEWRSRYKELCDLGVDCLVGSHPHVAQGFEEYNGKTIFYSLGNFYFPNLKKPETIEYGYSIVFDIAIDKKMSFEIIYHKIKDYKINIISKSDSTIDFKYLNRNLENETYRNRIEEEYIKAYNEIC